MRNAAYIVIDLETTGLDHNNDEIIEIGAVKIENNQIIQEFEVLVKPRKAIPFEIVELTGISNEMLTEAIDIKTAIAEFLKFAGDIKVFIAHNKSFEQNFMAKHLDFVPDWLDTIEIAQIVRPLQRYFRLEALIELFDLTNKNPHRALPDALATAELFIRLLEELRGFDTKVWQKFLLLCQAVNCPLADLINYEGKQALRSFPTTKPASFNDPTDYSMIDGTLLFNNQDAGQSNCNWQLSHQPIDDFYSNLVSQSQEFEVRPPQIEMSKMVTESFNQHYCLLVEAGTGTGKSLAYLLPAVLYALGSKMPVTISTNTINLQEQLINKDIPMLKLYLQKDFSAVVVKGRSNYLCKRKWQAITNEVDPTTLPLFLRIAYWLTFTTTGDFGDLNLFGHDYEIFQRFAAHSETCGSVMCPHFKNQCYINNVRKMAAKADLIIINHSLLLATSFMCESGNGNILPPIENLIIDEAHQLETVAERQLSKSISLKSLEFSLAAIWRQEKLKNLVKYLEKIKGTETLISDLTAINNLATESRQSAGEFFTLSSNIMSTAKSPFQRQIRLLNQRFTPMWEPIESSLSNLIFTLTKLAKALHKLIEGFGGLDDPFFSVDVVGSFKMAALGLLEYVQTAENILDNKNPQRLIKQEVADDIAKEQAEECVIWLEKSLGYGRDRETLTWFVCPADIRNALCDYLYKDKQSLIMTSATLTNNSFDFFINEVGLNQSNLEIKTYMLESPFDYKNNSRILLAEDISDFTKTNEVVCIKEISDALFKLISASKGRALVLFTSYQQQRAVYKELTPKLKGEGINVLAHGISGGRDHILSAQKNNPKSCILGVSSFWEGVDIQGDALSMLVIVRLPFMPPNTPTLEARFQRMEANGQNPFSDFSLPQAVIRFKQGFGRLIRSKEDRGLLCVLDKRIWAKSYGKKFLSALPDMDCTKADVDSMAGIVKEFLD